MWAELKKELRQNLEAEDWEISKVSVPKTKSSIAETWHLKKGAQNRPLHFYQVQKPDGSWFQTCCHLSGFAIALHFPPQHMKEYWKKAKIEFLDNLEKLGSQAGRDQFRIKNISGEEARKIADDYVQRFEKNALLDENPPAFGLSWIDGHRKIDHPVWLVGAQNLSQKARYLEGCNHFTFVVSLKTGQVEDVHLM